MNNNIMPRSKTSIKLPFALMDRAGNSWPMLVVFLRIASEHAYGVVPFKDISLARVRNVFAAPDDEIRRQGSSLQSSELVVGVDMPVILKGNGWEESRTVSGWYCPSWPDVCSDKRRVKREGIKIRDDVVLFGPKPDLDTGVSELKMLEEKALQSMNVGGRRGRVLCLDAVSMKWLMSLNKKHGFDAVSDALEKSAGADRPVAMAKKILSKKGRDRGASVPSADEWRRG